jgi:hypothetical protein
MGSHLLGMLGPASILQLDRHTGSALLLPNCSTHNIIIEGSGSFFVRANRCALAMRVQLKGSL